MVHCHAPYYLKISEKRHTYNENQKRRIMTQKSIFLVAHMSPNFATVSNEAPAGANLTTEKASLSSFWSASTGWILRRVSWVCYVYFIVGIFWIGLFSASQAVESNRGQPRRGGRPNSQTAKSEGAEKEAASQGANWQYYVKATQLSMEGQLPRNFLWQQTLPMIQIQQKRYNISNSFYEKCLKIKPSWVKWLKSVQNESTPSV